jgi:ATP-dependent Lon protease
MNKKLPALSSAKVTKKIESMPVLALRDVVIYPNMVIPLFIGRDKSVKALEEAMNNNKRILLVAQKDSGCDNPTVDDVYQVGTVSTILQLLKLPDSTLKVLVEGNYRGKIDNFTMVEPFFSADIKLLESPKGVEKELEILLKSLIAQFEQYVKFNKKLPPEIIASLLNISDPSRLIDTIAAHVLTKIEEKQEVLELEKLTPRIEYLIGVMKSEIDVLKVKRKIEFNVKKQMEKSQRQYYLNEEMKAIQKELGEMDEATGNEIEDLRRKIIKSKMSQEAKEKATVELNKLKLMPPMSAEATVCRNYIDCLLSIPWKSSTNLSNDLKYAEEVLEADHYGLEKVKERIVEYLAVQMRVKKCQGPVICLVGPPGVGKTSLGESIARAIKRKFLRVSLGGVRDEAEIRGHRRTYIGAMPGKIIQKVIKSKVNNPLFLLDEIDKMSSDFRGDPASALLEVLDSEQNNSFNDHYLEVDYDLSKVMFIATANSLDIPLPLLDRMEIIWISGYTEDEKLNIATRYLFPKQMKSSGLKKSDLKVKDDAIMEIIRYYTREAGVRSLEREIAKICRKVVKDSFAVKKHKSVTIKVEDLEKYLGVRKYRFGEIDKPLNNKQKKDWIGTVTGLAWTEAGGDILTIEATAVTGDGKVARTGKLGEVMQESIQAAVTVVRSRATSLGINDNFYKKHDIHIHVPTGATPKDGPSAGIAMSTALVSLFTNIPVRKDVAMTGEITLRGKVLPIGGLKEKLLAARRAGITTVIIPEENMNELKEIPENIYKDLKIYPVNWIDQVFDIALESIPKPKGLTKKQLAAMDKPELPEAIQVRKNRRKGTNDIVSRH